MKQVINEIGEWDLIKVIYIVPRLNNAGPVNQLFDLVNRLCNICMVKVVTLYSEIDDSQWDRFNDLSIELESLNIKLGLSFLSVGKALKKKLDEEKPCIVHSETLPADFAVYLSRIKDIFWCSTIHCNIYSDYKTRFGYGISRIMIRLHELCINKMDRAICCSASIMEVYEKKYGKKITIVQNGVDCHEFAPLNESDIKYVRDKQFMTSNKKVVLVVGSLDERKNSLFIVHSLRQWLKSLNMQIVFLGSGPLENECKKAAEGYDIVFKGKVKDVKKYLQCADVYLSASRSEGLPLSVLEAGACGLPMILSDIPSHREFCMYGKPKGLFYFDIEDENTLLNIFKNMDFSEETVRAEMARYFQEHFSTEKMANEYLNIYINNVEA